MSGSLISIMHARHTHVHWHNLNVVLVADNGVRVKVGKLELFRRVFERCLSKVKVHLLVGHETCRCVVRLIGKMQTVIDEGVNDC